MARILLVEDDIDVRVLLEHVLTTAGYLVSSVETVRSAKRLLEAQPYDLVVADGVLPDGTGVDVADEAAVRKVGTLIITGHPLRLPVSQYPYLLKPVRPAEMIEAIRSMLPQQEGDADIVPFPRPA